MPSFQYEVRTSAGAVSTGTLAAASMQAASQQLRQGGQYVLRLTPASGASGKSKSLKDVQISFGPSQKDIQAFTAQLSVMVRAGISLRAAIEGIADQTENPKFQKMLRQIQADVESGKPFSQALQRYPKKFGPLYVNMVRASELSGGFSKMLDRIAGYLTQQIETAQQVKGAMIYPGIIGGLAVSVTVFLLTFVLPRFTVLFEGKEAILPLPTKILLAISDFLILRWYVVLIGLVVGIWGLVLMLKTERGRVGYDRVKLMVPLFKKMFRALYITRSLHAMGQLINAGVPMLDTIAITAEISGNVHFKRMWRSVYVSVKQGKKISQPLSGNPLLPRATVQMIAAGEESGRLGEVLDEVSEFYNRELKAVIKNCTAMIEPLMIIVMGGLVGFIAMSIILPIFKLSSLVE
ncbi:MAG: type II secretion system F family protein [Planctomycetota bacterium]